MVEDWWIKDKGQVDDIILVKNIRPKPHLQFLLPNNNHG
jgi:hypothetical protein